MGSLWVEQIVLEMDYIMKFSNLPVGLDPLSFHCGIIHFSIVVMAFSLDLRQGVMTPWIGLFLSYSIFQPYIE